MPRQTPGQAKKPHPVDVHVGRRVRGQRAQQGLSQTAMADRLGLTFQQLQKYESGANRISASRLWQIAETLEMPVAWFFEGIREGGDARDSETCTTRATLEILRSIRRCPKPVQDRLRALTRAIAEDRAPEALPAAE